MVDFNDYQELAETGFTSPEPVKPEDEFFHSIYIAGKTRKNHINVEEYAGKIQVRGVEYNLDKVYMIITNVKDVLVKNVIDPRTKRERTECFSFKEGPGPWVGSSGRQCGMSSAERASIDYCSLCKAQIIVAGVYCDSNGKPHVGEDGKPIFGFIRGKGMKYSNVSGYLSDMYNKEFPPLFTPPTEESKRFEKAVVNNKRCVTEISIGKANSNYGEKDVFNLVAGTQLQDSVVLEILKITKKTLEKFNEKFNWANKMKVRTVGYGDEQASKGILPIGEDDGNNVDLNKESSGNQTSGSDSFMSFSDVEF